MKILSKLYEKLKNKFDICYVLNLSSRPDKRKFMETQFNKMGFDNIYENNWYHYHYATEFKYNELIADAFNRSGKGKFTKPNEYDCARNHYAIVKECYDRGFNSVLIMEDDIKFIKDSKLFIKFIDNIPDDYDVLQFGAFTVDPKVLDILNKFNKNIYWTTHRYVHTWNCSMYALSRKGMQYYLAFMNKFFWVADGPLYKAPVNHKLINSYLSTVPIVIQADKDLITSDIRTKETDSIDYNTRNLYESKIDKNDYF